MVIKTPELSKMVGRDVDIELTNLGLYERLSSILLKLPLQYGKDGTTTVVSSYVSGAMTSVRRVQYLSDRRSGNQCRSQTGSYYYCNCIMD